ncbi:hypothetical protein LNTAR_07064 [Lentisphaera araneosa HTCC2155]|uniref:Lipoprotein n=1 Tax=Lentisphaera araneosa HTCC2155 TaxID=313628 RepID=A6DMU8_9BACT|nr:hypothetical protein [Lentisphaera araneosa]EDM26984.1 hypothetical protein LNTAR_07064 [Lentisphaera araneosa HTCC2155]
MKKHFNILLLSFFFVACQSQEKIAVQAETNLFPLEGVTLGKTTEDEIRLLGEESDKFNYYKVRGQNFWIKGGLAEHMYVTRGSEWPHKWRNYNFSWYLSYDEWIEVLENIGYEVTVIEPPRVDVHNDHPSLYAKLRATKKEETTIQLNLDFRFSKNTKTDQHGSLCSIKIRSL